VAGINDEDDEEAKNSNPYDYGSVIKE